MKIGNCTCNHPSCSYCYPFQGQQQKVYSDDLLERLTADNQRIKDLEEALKTAHEELISLWSFYGQNLQVLNWHQNGATEPLDSFFEDNNHGAVEVLQQALKEKP